VDVIELAAKKKKPLMPRPEECSAATIQDCSTSKCCQDIGWQCFQKNASFAGCLEKCDSSVLLKAGKGKWTCKAIGKPFLCAGLKENCMDSGCCADVGHQCYAKNSNYAQCLQTCAPEEMRAYDPRKEAWSCEPIGQRYTLDYRNDYFQDKDHRLDHMRGVLEVEPWVKNCSHIGDDCSSTKCCAWSGFKCYRKDDGFAGCLQRCHPGKWNGGEAQMPMVQEGKPLSNPPAHWNVTFKVAPPGPWSCQALKPALKPAHLVGTSLYCFTVALSNNGGKKPSFELEILKKAQEMKSHVFMCDHWTVYSNVNATFNPGKAVTVDYPHLEKRPNTKIWVNLPLFMNVWKSIKQATTWKSFPWIVKADPTAVFLPERLRAILAHQHVTDQGVFLENCKFARMSFHGSLEVISNVAFGTFLDNLDTCNVTLRPNDAYRAHFHAYGEDKFAAWCMQANGVDRVPSLQEVDTVPKNQHITGLHLTVSCPGHRTGFELHDKDWHPNCTRAKTAGLHAFRTVAKYVKCLEQTRAA
jgi:hypothetical protein